MNKAFLTVVFMLFSAVLAASEPVFLTLPNCESGETLFVSVKLDGLFALKNSASQPFFGVELYADEEKIASQFVPGAKPNEGVLIFVAPKKTPEIRLTAADENSPSWRPAEEILIDRNGFSVVHQKGVQGGFPAQIVFKQSDKKIEMRWNDRLYDARGGLAPTLCSDTGARIERFDGPLATVVRSRSLFGGAEHKTDSNARAIYTWYYLNDDRCFVTAEYAQDSLRFWNEHHFLELHTLGQFGAMAGPDVERPLAADAQLTRFDRWGALVSDGDAVAFFGPKTCVYDGATEPETYLHADPDASWSSWSSAQDFHVATIFIGTLGDSGAKKIDEMEQNAKCRFFEGRLSVPTLENRCETWRSAAALRLILDGRLTAGDDPAAQLDAAGFVALEIGDLGLLFGKTGDDKTVGLALAAAVDRKTKSVLTDSTAVPLFELEIKTPEGNVAARSSLEGWKSVERSGSDWIFEPADKDDFPTVTVRLETTDGGGAAFRYELGESAARVTALTVGRFSRWCEAQSRLVWPRCSGVVYDPTATALSLRSAYPTGFDMTMQWSAMWNESERRGLYFGVHDPHGASKKFSAVSDVPGGTVEFSCRIPDPNNAFLSDIAVVFEPFDGDWYDAAQIYKRWVRTADWYPTLDENGRPDTPEWFKKLSLWTLFQHQEKDAAITALRRFQAEFDVPAGVHWYGWHGIAFDNDYPHYFPTQDGFSDAVLELQKEGNIHIMPYINGRLWDTRDKGTEDWLFTKEGLSGTTKDENGKPFTESYCSLESDGSKVVLAVMCPTTAVWQNKVRENVLRLMNQCGVDAVYIDQIAAAVPKPCFDAAHGHPLGDGAWWVPAYQTMLDKIRADMRSDCADDPPTDKVAESLKNRSEMPRERVLTTECNAEPFMRGLDGYLTWHWQNDGEVPAFSAVYGGAIQLFGRCYSGDTVAQKMKAAEELVYGEQIGWFDAAIVDRAEEFAFIRPLVRFRQSIVEYFYRGEMARPPKFLDSVPTVTGDWRWSNNPTSVTAPTVRAGCWRLTDGERAIVIFSNTSNETVRSRIAVDFAELGFDPALCNVRRVDSEGNRGEPLPKSVFDEPMEFLPLETWGLEISR